MFGSEFDQDMEPENSADYPEQWEDYPPAEQDLDNDGAYPQEGVPGFSPDPADYYPPTGYPTGDYSTDDYLTEDFPIGVLPKFLFICTVLACLALAGVLSLVTIQFPSTPALPQAKTAAGSQPQADTSQPSSPVNTDCSVSQRFPDSIRRWCGLITQYASKHSLPPNLVAALIWQESGGNPVAYSQSGAVGLMQVMPSDGLASSFQCVGGPCFSNRPSTDQLKNPEFNVSYGTRMLAGLVGKTGSLREALKSYGPANVGYYYADKVLGIYQTYSN
jgi:hypothetical protein